MVFVVENEENDKNDNWNFWFLGVLVQRWPFRDAHLFFKKNLAETPIFIVFLGARFLGQVVKKKEILDTHQNKKKKLTDN